MPAILTEISRVIYLNDGEVVTLQPSGVKVTNLDGQPVQLGPREPVDRELQRVGGRRAVGLPVDDLPGLAPVGVEVAEDGIDPADDLLAAEDQ